MAYLTISAVARQVGLRTSAIRYYEQIGLLPPAERSSGQRRYDMTAVHRLAAIQRARQLGFSLDEIRQLFFGFRTMTRASERWRKLSQRKLAELETMMEGIKSTRRLIRRMMRRCHCETMDQCGRGIFRNSATNTAAPSAILRRRVDPLQTR